MIIDKIGIEYFADKRFGFLLKDSYREKLFELAKVRAGGLWVKLAEKLEVPPSYLYRFRKDGRSISYTLLVRIADITKLPLSQVEKNITHIRSGGKFCKIRLPILLNEDLVGLVAHGFGDGHIVSKNFNFRYCNKDINLIQKVHDMVTRVFGKIGFYDQLSGHGIPVRTYQFIVGYVLYILGVPKGNKTIQEFYLPKWIFACSKNLKIAFLRGLFSDEGGIRNGDYRSISLAFVREKIYENSLKNFLEDIKNLLKEFEINSKEVSKIRCYVDKGKKEKVVLGFNIAGFNNLVYFRDKINFSSPSKCILLHKIIESFKIRPEKLTKKLIISTLERCNYPKTAKQIAKEIGKAESTVRKYLRILLAENKVMCLQKPLRNKLWCIK